MRSTLGIATRFYGLSVQDVDRLSVWVESALSVVSPKSLYVAINIDADSSGGLSFMKERYPDVVTFPVTPWGRVVQAPNALLIKSAENVTHLLYTSTEYPVIESLATRLLSHVDDETLVVGARTGEHDFKAEEGETVFVEHASGRQIPWNTYALWSIRHLIHTGFVLTADSFADSNNAGMEEMGTISAQQILWPDKAKAKVVAPRSGELFHNTHGWTVARHERFGRNLESKDRRSTAQLERLSLPPPNVYHIG
jgi:hypothetical protein